MAKMIKPETIAFKATVSEEDIRARMVQEVLEGIGGWDVENDRPAIGIQSHVTMSGDLLVVRLDEDGGFIHKGEGLDSDQVLATIKGIPNDGGDW